LFLAGGGLVLLVLLMALWWATAYQRGMRAARLDHSRGHYEVQEWGLGRFWYGMRDRLLKERYGVETRFIGRRLSDWEERYAEGYNSVSRRLLNEKYGKDIFKECSYAATHPPSETRDE
jgi:hypothetical protein